MTKRMQEIRNKLSQNAEEFDALVVELITLAEGKKTIIVNGIEVPAPETEKPECNTEYYVPEIGAERMYDCWSWGSDDWGSDDVDDLFLSRGLLYLNKEDAIERCNAMLIIQEKE